MWEFEWQNIKFCDLSIKLNFFRRASAEFYSAFYEELFSRYKGYDDLPKIWQENKFETAREISKLLNDQMKIMSIGCGLGYIERSLVNLNSEINIDAYDFSLIATKWLEKIQRVEVIHELIEEKKYDFIFCTQLLYALSDKEIKDLAILLKSLLEDGSIFMTVDASANNTENGYSVNKESLVEHIKNILRHYYYLLFVKRHKAQFWGWQRDNQEIIKIFTDNGFFVQRKYSAVGQSFLIFTNNKT